MSTPEPVPQPGRVDDEVFGLEVLLIRHGESMAVVPGSPESEDPRLSERGVEQVAALAARLDGRQLDAVYSSDLARAVATADALAAPRGLEVQQRADLREVHLGEWENGGFSASTTASTWETLSMVGSSRVRFTCGPSTRAGSGRRRCHG